MVAGLRSWFRNLFRRRSVEDLLDEELRACVEILAAQKERAGLPPVEARRQALLEIGGVEVVKERVREARRASMADAFARDLRHGARVLRKQPLATLAIILTLGLGIGSPAAAFSFLNHFIFAPPPNPDPAAFFRVAKRMSGHDLTIGVDEYLAMRDRSTSASHVAAWSVWMMRAPLGIDDPTPVLGSLVSCNLLTLFKVDVPVAGRLLNAGDCGRDTPIAVMNERTWRARFGGDPSIIGSTLRYGGAQVMIVGVAAAPPLRRQWDDADEVVDLFVPYTAHKQMKDAADWARSGHGWLHVGGLLRPGVALETAAAEFQAIEAAAAPPPSGREPPLIVLTNGSRWDEAPGEMLGILAMALALPALILIMSCVNVSALLLSRSVGRRQEMAIRLALGTSRGALVRMLLTETLLMAAFAAGLALVVVAALPPALVRAFDAEAWFGSADALAPGWRVLTTLGICGAAAALLAGLAPALTALNPRPIESLKGRPESGPRGTSRTQRWLVGLQVGASMVPLVVAVAFSSAVVQAGDPGFPTSGLLVADVPEARPRDVAIGRIAETLSTFPGVTAVAFAGAAPMVSEASIRVAKPGLDASLAPVVTMVSPGYFDTIGLGVLAGRGFTDGDEGAAAKPIVISSQFARRLFGEGRGVGERLDARLSTKLTETWTIVGVVTDRRIGRASRSTLADGSAIYRPMSSSSKAGVLLVRTAGDIDAAASALRDRLRAELGSVPSVRTLDEALADTVSVVRKLGSVTLGLGILAFLLAIVGIVGTVSFDARQRRKEFAVRQALGAGPWVVVRRVVASGLWPVVPAMAAGLLGAWGALSAADAERLSPSRSMADDMAPYVVIATLLLFSVLATLLAIAYPASRRDPLLALREE